ncbi:MAG: peptidoglycan-binding protein [Methanobrevibacter sp.]|nr:peptidoglycan-binding protein [Methanobrevibacter sp.]
MTGEELAKKCQDILLNYKTYYAKGTFGQCATPSFLNTKKKQYPDWYNSRIDKLLALPDDTRLFDCVGLIKACCWGFPNTIYTSNYFKDYSDQSLWDACTDKSTDFSKIEVGEVLWVKGHVGVYVGNGTAIECTTAWKNKVQYTAVANIKVVSGMNNRKWTGHGKIPTIVYNAPQGSNSNEKPKVDYSKYPTLQMKIDPKTKAYLTRGEYVKIMQELLKAKGCDPNGIDGVFGKDTKSALKKFQQTNTDINGKKLVVDCICGQKTWGSLYK